MSYYRGDPGFFSSLGNIIKGVAAPLVSFIPGVGPIASKAIGGGLAALPKFGAGTIGKVGSAIIKHPGLTAAGGAAVVGLTAGGIGSMVGARGMVPAGMHGYHIEKRGKHAGQMIKNRHMRVTNPKALRRALRRAHGFAKLAMRTIHLVYPKKKGRFGGFKVRRRKK